MRIAYRNIKPSAALEADIREKAGKLGVFYNKILDCRVIIETPHLHHRRGKLFHIRIGLTVPGGEIVVKHEPKRLVGVLSENRAEPDLELASTREPSKYSAHRDVYAAIHDAFDAARRKLQDHARQRRGAVKARRAGATEA